MPMGSLLRRHLRPGRSVVLALVGFAVLAVGGCAEEPTADPRRDGLLVLTGSGDGQASLSLTSADEARTETAGIDLPAPATTWVAGGRGGVLAATVADGTLQLSSPVVPGLVPTWHQPDATGPTGDPPPGPLAYPTWDPEGGRLAMLGGMPGGGTDVVAVLLDPQTAAIVAFPIAGGVLASPPAWLDGDRLAVVTGDRADPVVMILDTATGDVTPGPAGVSRIASSGDGRVIAKWTGNGEAVVVLPSAWLTGGTEEPIAVMPSPHEEATLASMALDAGGQRLAIAWLMPDGSMRIDVHAAPDWGTPQSETMLGNPGAVVGWRR